MLYFPDTEKNLDAEHEYLVAVSELRKLLKGGMSILRNKDSIIHRIDTLESLTKQAMDKHDKADLAIYDLHKLSDEFIVEIDDALEKLKAVRKEKFSLSSELQSVKSENRQYSELYSMIERIDPSILHKAKEMVHEEKQLQHQRNSRSRLNISPQERKNRGDLNNRRNLL